MPKKHRNNAVRISNRGVHYVKPSDYFSSTVTQDKIKKLAEYLKTEKGDLKAGGMNLESK